MIIPIAEILNNNDHTQFKSNYEIALEYQLGKILSLTKKIEQSLDKQLHDPHWYFKDKQFHYDLDSLINSLSTLTEYYHGWIIFSHIGTTEHQKATYKPLKNDVYLDKEISAIFKKHSIGVLKASKIDPAIFYENCKQAFMQAYDFLFIGKFYEIYVLNNYLKHNMITMGYSPKAVIDGKQIIIPYLYIIRPNDRLLNNSVYKCLFDHVLDHDEKISNIQRDYFVDIINNTSKKICKIGGLKVLNINEIDYLIGTDTIGLSIESILEVTHDLVKNIVKVFLDSSKGNLTREQEMGRILVEIKKRPPQTLSKLVR